MKHYMSLCLVTALAACGGDSGGGQPAPTPKTYTVGGSITGLTTAGLVLANGSDTTQPASGATAFTLPTALPTGTSYQVSVQAQPAGLTCSVQGANGSVGAADVGNVAVSCTPVLFGIGGTLTGLTGSGLVLANGGDTVAVAAGAAQFTLPSHAAGTAYDVVVQTQPAGQHCSVASGSGTVPAQGVADIRVACSSHVLYVAGNSSNKIDILPLDASGMPQLSGMTQASAEQYPRRLVASPDGKHLYACATGANRIDQYDIGADGTLTPMTVPGVDTGDLPYGFGITPDGHFAYAASSHTGSVWMFSVGADGALSPLATPSVATAFAATTITISADGTHLYSVGDSSAAVFTIGGDGRLTLLATVPVGLSPYDLVLSPNGKYAYVDSVSPGKIRQFAVQADGTLVALGDVSANLSSPVDITLSHDGAFAYVPDWDNNVVLQYAVGANGLLAPLATPSAAVGDGPLSVTLSDDGKKAYVANGRDNTVAVFDVNADGTLAPASKQTFAVPAMPYHLLFR
jgi:6-phosphogluconolactonase